MGKNLAWLLAMLIVITGLGWLLRPRPPEPPLCFRTPEPGAIDGLWAVNANGYRQLLELKADGPPKARLKNEVGQWEEMQQVMLPPPEGPHGPWMLSFYRPGPRQYWRCTLWEGELKGHFSHKVDKPEPEDFHYPIEGVHPPPSWWKVGPPWRPPQAARRVPTNQP